MLLKELAALDQKLANWDTVHSGIGRPVAENTASFKRITPLQRLPRLEEEPREPVPQLPQFRVQFIASGSAVISKSSGRHIQAVVGPPKPAAAQQVTSSVRHVNVRPSDSHLYKSATERKRQYLANELLRLENGEADLPENKTADDSQIGSSATDVNARMEKSFQTQVDVHHSERSPSTHKEDIGDLQRRRLEILKELDTLRHDSSLKKYDLAVWKPIGMWAKGLSGPKTDKSDRFV